MPAAVDGEHEPIGGIRLAEPGRFVSGAVFVAQQEAIELGRAAYIGGVEDCRTAPNVVGRGSAAAGDSAVDGVGSPRGAALVCR
ncbi:hypothetical protein [Nocardia sp. BMG51109]|uniref:hypothetical protein n=1 Tax=Nocardia sp. BMG51109 TaxID=1056816 RepID=UPI0012EB1CD2|nr:hypothetical protein [Nocardia sp. BMG51109]